MNIQMMPKAPEVEEAVLSHAFIGEFEQVKESVMDSYFTGYNADIWLAMKELDDCSSVTLINKLREKGTFEAVGGDYLITKLVSSAYGDLEYLIEILKEKHIARLIIEQSQIIQNKAFDSTTDVYTLVEELTNLSATVDDSTGRFRMKTVDYIIERDKTVEKAEKIEFAVHKLDRKMYEHTMRRGQVILTIADSGHGKTQWALYKAAQLARQGYVVAWFQLEGYDTETANAIHQMAEGYGGRFFVADEIYNLEEIKRQSRIIKRKYGLDYLVIDYIQEVETQKNMKKVEATEYISREVRKMAKSLNCVVNPLSQVTIDYSRRTDWKAEPTYSDVRWSQQLKQDASMIESVFRPAYIDSLVVDKLTHCTVKDWNGDEQAFQSVYIKQCKNRHGQKNPARLHMIHTQGNGLQMFENRQNQYAPASESADLPF